MPGVGKTALVKEIARKALQNDSRLFDNAVIVTISHTPNYKEIQQKIGERLDFKFTKKVLEERALELQNRLKDEKKFLIVLDDVWNEIKLENVGIVFESDLKSGCKILITSRFKRVLAVDMGVDKNFEVELLSEDEATNWFNVIVGDAARTHDFKEVGKKIVKKCGCLPLAISTVGHSLKNFGMPIWKDTLRQLERPKHGEIVHSSIKLCYDKLDSIEAKKLLLLCALHEEDENIRLENLMIYGFGVEMFEGVNTLQATRDRVERWVDLLKDRCLLLSGDEYGTMKMHDVIRGFAISIGKSHDMHCFRDGREVIEFLKEKKFEDLKAIFLPRGYVDELEFENSEYTNLELIICRTRKSSKPLFGDFLGKIKQLRVLYLDGTFESRFLAFSLTSPGLQNLRTLRLQQCEVHDIAEIGQLKNLEILVFYDCEIKIFPGEIGQLTRLRMLELRECYGPDVIEPNAIMHLKCLEELFVDCFRDWHKFDGVENNNWERRNAGLDELKYLDGLTALHICVEDVKMLPKVLVSTYQKLESYDISIGEVQFLDDEYDFSIGLIEWGEAQNSHSRELRINCTEISLIRDHGLEMLIKRAHGMWLNGLNGVKSMVSELEIEGFPELKCLVLKDNSTVEYLVNNSMGQIHPFTVFESLEKLFLEEMSNLKQICNGEVSAESFKTLRLVGVSDCDGLKKLFPFFSFRQLEEIEITYCKEVEEIFSHEIQDNCDDNYEKAIVEFPQLQNLILGSVPKLREFMSSKILKKKTCSSQKGNEPFMGDPVMPLFNGKLLCFPKLEKLELRGINVKKIWDAKLLPTSSTSFSCLTILNVSKCKYLKSLISSSMATSFKQLKHLEVEGCEAMEEIVSNDAMMDKISFPKLHYLYLKDLPKLSKFSSIILMEFPMLDELYITECPIVDNTSSIILMEFS